MLADVTGAQKFLTFYSVTTRRATYKGRPQDILFWELHYDVTGHLSAQEWEALEPAIDPVNMLANLAETSRPLDIPTPIQSWMYQELSDAMFSYCHCEKLCGVFIFAVLTPLYITCFTDSLILGPFFTFVKIWTVQAGRGYERSYRC